MSYDNTDVADVVAALNGSVGEVNMSATVDEIVTAGRMRRRRHRMVGVAAGVAAITGLGFAVNYGGPVAAPTTTAATARTVHIHTVAYTVDSQSDGTVRLTWDKRRYFNDREALQTALRHAGMPIIMRVGEFCSGPHDDTTLDASESGQASSGS